MIRVANVLMLSPGGELILQQRDNKPGISNPGRITAFGGGCDEGEEPLHAAKREMQEELGLDLQDSDLTFWKTYRKTMAEHGEDAEVYLFILNHRLRPQDLTVHEGQGYFLVSAGDNLDRVNFSTAARQFVQDFLKEYAMQ